MRDPQHPDRPQHPDLASLSEIILQADGSFEEGGASFEEYIEDIVDLESIEYVAFQRVIRVLAVENGIDPRKGRMPAQILRDNAERISTMMALYFDAFITGHRFMERKTDAKDV